MDRSRRAPVRCTHEQPQQRLRPLAPPPTPPSFVHPPLPPPLPRDPHRGNTSGPDYFLDPLASAPSAATGEAPPGATISNADLIAQLQARQEAKARRDFATADAIRFALERQHGVKVTDSTKSWIANDGRKGNTVGPNFFSLDGTPFAAGYQAPAGVGQGAPPGMLTTEAIYVKLAEREDARRKRDYPAPTRLTSTDL